MILYITKLLVARISQVVTNQLDDRINVYNTRIAENDIPSEHGFLSN